MGYHLNKIDKGVLGFISKIREEFQELEDAHMQGNKVLQICELCDLVGAIKAYAKQFNLSLDDLNMMEEATAAAFKDGTRTSVTLPSAFNGSYVPQRAFDGKQ